MPQKVVKPKNESYQGQLAYLLLVGKLLPHNASGKAIFLSKLNTFWYPIYAQAPSSNAAFALSRNSTKFCGSVSYAFGLTSISSSWSNIT